MAAAAGGLLALCMAAYGAWSVQSALTTGRYVGRHRHVIEQARNPVGYWTGVAFSSVGAVMFTGLGGLLLYHAIRSTAAEDRRIDGYLRKRAEERRAP